MLTCKQGHNSPICQKSGFWKCPILHCFMFYWHTPEKNSQSCIVQHIGGIWRAQSPEQGVASCESCNNVGLQLHAQFWSHIQSSIYNLYAGFVQSPNQLANNVLKIRYLLASKHWIHDTHPSKWVWLWGQEKCHDLSQNVNSYIEGDISN